MSSARQLGGNMGLLCRSILFIGIVFLHFISLDALMNPFLKADVRLQIRNPYNSKQNIGPAGFVPQGGWLPRRIGNPHHHHNLPSLKEVPVFHSPTWRRHSSRASEFNHHLHNLAHKLGIRLHIYGGKKPPGSGEWDGHLKTFKEFGPTKDKFFAHNKKLNDIKWESNVYHNQKHQESGFIRENAYEFTAGQHENDKHYGAPHSQIEHSQNHQVEGHNHFLPMPQIGYLLDGTYDDITTEPNEPDCTQGQCKDSEGLYSFEVKRQKHKNEERELIDGHELLKTRFKLKKRKNKKKNLHQVEYEGTPVNNYHSAERVNTKEKHLKNEKPRDESSEGIIYITERPNASEFLQEYLKERHQKESNTRPTEEYVQTSVEHPPLDFQSSPYHSMETTRPFNYPSSTDANIKAESNGNLVVYLNSDSNGSPVISHDLKHVNMYTTEAIPSGKGVQNESKPTVRYFIPSPSNTHTGHKVVKYSGEQVLLVVPKHESPKLQTKKPSTTSASVFKASRQEIKPQISKTTIVVNTTTPSPTPKEVNYNPNRMSSHITPEKNQETDKPQMDSSGSSPKITVIGPGDKAFDIVFGKNYHLVPLPHLILEQPVFPSITVQPAKLGSFESTSLFSQKPAFSKRVGDESTEWIGYHASNSGTTIPSTSIQTQNKTEFVVPSTTQISEPTEASNYSSNKPSTSTEATTIPATQSTRVDGILKKTLESDSSSQSDEKDVKKIVNPLQVLELELSKD